MFNGMQQQSLLSIPSIAESAVRDSHNLEIARTTRQKSPAYLVAGWWRNVDTEICASTTWVQHYESTKYVLHQQRPIVEVRSSSIPDIGAKAHI
jgi:hypothetical protein